MYPPPPPPPSLQIPQGRASLNPHPPSFCYLPSTPTSPANLILSSIMYPLYPLYIPPLHPHVPLYPPPVPPLPPRPSRYLKGAPPNVLVACKGQTSCKGQGQGQGLGLAPARRVSEAVDLGSRDGDRGSSGVDSGVALLTDNWSSILSINNNSNNTTTNTTTTTPTNTTTTTTTTTTTSGSEVAISGPLSDYLSPRLHVIYPPADNSFQLGSDLKDWGNPHFPTVPSPPPPVPTPRHCFCHWPWR